MQALGPSTVQPGPKPLSLLQKLVQTLAQGSSAAQMMHSQQTESGCLLPSALCRFCVVHSLEPWIGTLVHIRNFLKEPKAPADFPLAAAERRDGEFRDLRLCREDQERDGVIL